MPYVPSREENPALYAFWDAERAADAPLRQADQLRAQSADFGAAQAHRQIGDTLSADDDPALALIQALAARSAMAGVRDNAMVTAGTPRAQAMLEPELAAREAALDDRIGAHLDQALQTAYTGIARTQLQRAKIDAATTTDPTALLANLAAIHLAHDQIGTLTDADPADVEAAKASDVSDVHGARVLNYLARGDLPGAFAWHAATEPLLTDADNVQVRAALAGAAAQQPDAPTSVPGDAPANDAQTQGPMPDPASVDEQGSQAIGGYDPQTALDPNGNHVGLAPNPSSGVPAEAVNPASAAQAQEQPVGQDSPAAANMPAEDPQASGDTPKPTAQGSGSTAATSSALPQGYTVAADKGGVTVNGQSRFVDSPDATYAGVLLSTAPLRDRATWAVNALINGIDLGGELAGELRDNPVNFEKVMGVLLDAWKAFPKLAPDLNPTITDLMPLYDAMEAKIGAAMRREVHDWISETMKVGEYTPLAPLAIGAEVLNGDKSLGQGATDLAIDYVGGKAAIAAGKFGLGMVGVIGSRGVEKGAHEVVQAGGAYKDVKRIAGYEAHHMPAASVNALPAGEGPAIAMAAGDHRLTRSWGNFTESRLHRESQAKLISQGDFRGAQQMDIDDIRRNFGDKYDEAIQQMIRYSKDKGLHR